MQKHSLTTKKLIASSVFACALLLLLFLLTLFNRPFIEFHKIREKFTALQLLSSERHYEFKKYRSPDGLKSTYQELSKTNYSCTTPFNLVLRNNVLVPTRGSSEVFQNHRLDLRQNYWRLKVASATHIQCVYDEDRDRAISKKEFDQKLVAQFSVLKDELLLKPFLIEISIEVPKDKLQNEAANLSLGIVNGTSGVFHNGSLIAYFSERIESGRFISVPLKAGTNKLSLLIYGRGFPYPGISHVSFVGLFDQAHPPVDLFENNYVRQQNTLLTVVVSLVLSVILFIFGLFNAERSTWPTWLASSLISFALTQSLGLDHVQSNLDGIRFFRAIGILIFSGSLLAIYLQLIDRIKKLMDPVLSGIMGSTAVEGVGVFLTTLRLVSIGAFFATVWVLSQNLGFNQTVFRTEYDALVPISSFSIVIGLLLLATSIALQWKYVVSESEEVAHVVQEAKRLTGVAGVLVLLYIFSYREFLAQWLKLEKVPGIGQLLGSQMTPMVVAFTVLVLMARILREQAVYRKVLSPSVQEMIPRLSSDPLSLDLTATEYNWILLNDVVGSTRLKLNQLAIVTHLLQSVFHKIHKDYFKDCIHFIQSMGDAVLLAVKAPKKCRKNDPMLEKLVRAYSLHKDGTTQLRDSYETVLALLRLHGKELHMALGEKSKDSEKMFSFRTILTADFYFYGLNHELSNIDSKSIYVISKSEKLIEDTQEGGFILFPDLMKLLVNAFPRIENCFEMRTIDRGRASESIRKHLPEFAFALKSECESDFEKVLEDLSGGQLYLRRSPETGASYEKISSAIADRCKQVSAAKNLVELEAFFLDKTTLPKSFIEKNALIRATTEAAVRLEVWADEAAQKKIQEWIYEVGLPAPALMRSIAERDQRQSPEALLKSVASIDPIVRNHAVRFLRLARVKNAFRPDAMSREEFTMLLVTSYLSRPGQFSVESHWYFYHFVIGNPEALKGFRDALAIEKNRKAYAGLISYLKSHSAPSLVGLAVAYVSLDLTGEESQSQAA